MSILISSTILGVCYSKTDKKQPKNSAGFEYIITKETYDPFKRAVQETNCHG
jgi:hypothetical protein